MTKNRFLSNLVNKSKKLFSRKSKKLLITLSLFGTIMSGVASFQLITNTNLLGDRKANAAYVLGGSALNGGPGDIAIDKKYATGGNPEAISVTPGQEITVRNFYYNYGGSPVTNAQIRDSLPAGFTYVQDSWRNCQYPTDNEYNCDNLPNNRRNDAFYAMVAPGVGVSPSSGLYGLDADQQGLLEMGKKRYIQVQSDTGGYFGQNATCNLISDNTPNIINTSFCSYDFGQGYGSGVMSSHYMQTKLDTFGVRNIQIQSDYTSLGAGTVDALTCEFRINNSGTFENQPACGGKPNSAYKGITELRGNRYLHLKIDNWQGGWQQACDLIASNYSVQPISNLDNQNAQPSPGSPYRYCWSKDGHNTPLVTDLLDTSRSRSFIEYKMIAPPTLGTFGTEARIAGAANPFNNYNTVASDATDVFVSGTNNSITVVANSITQASDINVSCDSVPAETATNPIYAGDTVRCNAAIGTTGVGGIVRIRTVSPNVGGCDVVVPITPAGTSTTNRAIFSCDFVALNSTTATLDAITNFTTSGDELTNNQALRNDTIKVYPLACVAGSYLQPNGSCLPCPVNTFCPAGATAPTNCSTGLNSVVSSTSIAGCLQIPRSGTIVGPASCAPNSVPLTTTTTCDWNVTAGTNGIIGEIFGGVMVDPNNINAGVLGNGSQCTLSGSVLSCTNIPTTGGVQGTARVMIHRPGVEYIAVGGSIFLTSSSNAGCPAGQFLNNGSCSTCTSGNYCIGGTTGQTACPADRPLSPAGAYADSQCTAAPVTSCPAGNYLVNGSCSPCTSGNYCIGGTTGQTLCPASTPLSPAGASTVSQCTSVPITSCPAGQFLNNGSCSTCTSGNYCIGGTTGQTACPADRPLSPAGAYADSQCTAAPVTSCPAGNYLVNGSCSPCTSGNYCIGGTTGQTLCPIDRTVSPPGSTSESNCTSNSCPPSKYLLLGACSPCPAGQFCVGGIFPPQVCPSNTYCVAAQASFTNCPINSTSPSGSTELSQCILSTCVNLATNYPQCNICTTGSTISVIANSCTPCPAGNYITSNGTLCTPCPAGKTCPGAAATPSTCPSNNYCPQGSIQGTPCPTPKISLAGSESISACFFPPCTNGGINTPDCNICVSGSTYYNSLCTPCPAGSAITNGVCGACPAGYTCAGGVNSPVACPANTFCPQGTIVAIQCQNPSHISPALSTSSAACVYPDCTNNAVNSPTCTTCAFGSTFVNNNCTPCPAGNSIVNITCTPCPAGGYCPGGVSAIIQCPANTYCLAGATTPSPCGGILISNAGSTAQTDCKTPICPNSATNPNDCNVCVAGSTFAPTNCTPCPAGSSIIANVCTICPAGSTCAGGTAAAVLCPANTFCVAGSINSTPCTSPKISNSGSASASACDYPPCNNGGINKPECNQCVAGSAYYNGVCSPCPAGFSITQGICNPCPAGSTCAGGTYPATICPVNKYCVQGSIFPVSCPTPKISVAGGTSVDSCVYPPCNNGAINEPTCTVCVAGSTLVSNTCTPCPAGSSIISGICSPCPAGSTCAGGSATPIICPANAFCPIGSINPIACQNPDHVAPAGSTNPAACTYPTCVNGAINTPQCTTCVAGSTFAPINCTPCAAGNSIIGNVCTPCPAGSTCPGGVTAAIVCPVNKYCPAGSVVPIACESSQQSLAGSTKIEDCKTCQNGGCNAQLKCINGSTSVPECKLTLGTVPTNVIQLQAGGGMPNVPLTGNTLPNGTPAILGFSGSSAPIVGTIQNNAFVPTVGQTIPANAINGISNAVLQSPGVPNILIPVNIINSSVSQSSTQYILGNAIGTPITLQIGQIVSSISLNGNTVPNSTVANLSFDGSSNAIIGTIQNNNFVPNGSQYVPSNSTIGISSATLSTQVSPNISIPFIINIIPVQETTLIIGILTNQNPITFIAGQPVPNIPLNGSTLPNGAVVTLVIPGVTTPITGTIVNGNFVPNAGQTLPNTLPNGIIGAILTSLNAPNIPVAINFVNGTTPTATTTVLGTTTTTTPTNVITGQTVPTITLTGSTVPNGTAATLTLPGSSTPITGTIVNGNFVPNPGQNIPAGTITGLTNGTISTQNAPSIIVPIRVFPAPSLQPINNSCTAGNQLSSTNTCTPCPINTYCLDNTTTTGTNGTRVPINCPAGTASFLGSTKESDCKPIRNATAEDLRTSIICGSSQLIVNNPQKCSGQLNSGIIASSLKLRFVEDAKVANLNGFKIGFMASGDQITEAACTVSNTGAISCPDVNLNNYAGTVKVNALSTEVITPVNIYNYTITKPRNILTTDLVTNNIKCTVNDVNSKTFANCAGQLPFGILQSGLKLSLALNNNKTAGLNCNIDTTGKITCDPYNIDDQSGSIDLMATTVDITTAQKIQTFDTTNKSCSAGEYGNPSNCKPCYAGYYCTDANSSKLCEIGTYCPLSSTKPTPCPSGKTTKVEGAKSINDCVDITSITAGQSPNTQGSGSTPTLQTLSAAVNQLNPANLTGVLARTGGISVLAGFSALIGLVAFFVIQNIQSRKPKFDDWKKM